MDIPIGEFNFSLIERVVFGPGKVAILGEELERRKLTRAVVVTGKTLGQSPLLERVTRSLGPRCAVVFRGARQHVPSASTVELAAEAKRVDADCLVSFGGGSPIDTAKVAAHALLERDLIHIALPTTLSAGEYTSGAGVTDESARVKHLVRDRRLQPRVVINDPELTLETPDSLWTATGMRAMDHAVEAIYSVQHQPLTDTLAAKAISLLVEHLPASVRTVGDEQLAHRGHCQMAAWFSIFGAGNVRMGISHALGHQIGPRWNVPHGVTSCITLPHVMRFMADLVPERFASIAAGLGVNFDHSRPRPGALECADRMARFIADLALPNTLSAVNVPREEIGEIVEPVAKEIQRMKAVGREVTRDELLALLVAAYQ